MPHGWYPRPVGRFTGRVVFITGASSGIGRALALEFAKEGALVAVAARRRDRLDALAAEIQASLGSPALPLECDVTRCGDVGRALALVLERFGRLDVAVANAGFGVAGDMESLDIEDYRRQFETNVFGVIATAKAALPHLSGSRGRLVLMGSVAGYASAPGVSAYSMSKFAVRALAEALYFELKSRSVSVTLISPGFVESEIRQVDNRGVHHPDAPDQVPGWLRMPSETAARKIVRAVARRRRELVLTGHGKLAVRVQRHFPGLLRLLIRAGLRGRKQPE